MKAEQETLFMTDYAGNKIQITGCPGCAFVQEKFSIPSGIVYRDEFFNIAQDWQLPIDGFLVISPIRHVLYLSELTDYERNEIFSLANKTIITLKKALPDTNYNLIICEAGYHLHIWLMPRHNWMKDLVGKNIAKNMGTIFDYAKANLKTKENIDKIAETCKLVKEEFQSGEIK